MERQQSLKEVAECGESITWCIDALYEVIRLTTDGSPPSAEPKHLLNVVESMSHMDMAHNVENTDRAKRYELLDRLTILVSNNQDYFAKHKKARDVTSFLLNYLGDSARGKYDERFLE